MSYGQQAITSSNSTGNDLVQQPALREYCDRMKRVIDECVDATQSIKNSVRNIMPHELPSNLNNEINPPKPPIQCAMDELACLYNMLRSNNESLYAIRENLNKIV